MKEIGGYFGLELSPGEEFHKDAIRLNTGRNACEYILRTKKYKKVYLPLYTCDVMLEPIKKLGVEYEFYNIDKTFRPIFNFYKAGLDEVFIYNNYFGICDKQAAELAEKVENLIIDNSQAFYAEPLPGVDTFYSCRKFFGVPDGAYLYTDEKLDSKLDQDMSYQRFEHLLGRIDDGPEQFYESFTKNDDLLVEQPIKKMSNITQLLLKSIDYEKVALRRQTNFSILHEALKEQNQLDLKIMSQSVPMIYPFFTNKGSELKKKLLDKKIFVATYWPNISDWSKKEDFEFSLYKDLVAFPIDQRCSNNDMKEILAIFKNTNH